MRIDGGQASLEVRVDAADEPLIRRAIVACGGAGTSVLRVSPEPRTSRVSVFVALQRESVDAVRGAVMGCVSSGEFGPLTHA